MEHGVPSRMPVFISYASADRVWLDRLRPHLEALELQDLVCAWSDREIEAGSDWRQSIAVSLAAAKAAVLLVSPAFLASRFIRSSEVPILLRRAKEEGVAILPIVLEPCLLKETLFNFPDPKLGPDRFSLASLQAANMPTRPLSGMRKHRRQEVFVKVAQWLLARVRPGSTEPLAGSSPASLMTGTQKTHEVKIDGDLAQQPEVTLATGTFVGRAGYVGRGSVCLVRRGDGQMELRFASDFAVSECPGPMVYLSSRGSIGHTLDTNMDIHLGALRAFSGAQVYAVPAGAEVGRPFIWVYDTPFRVEVSVAELAEGAAAR
jgi:hypothetical protein